MELGAHWLFLFPTWPHRTNLLYLLFTISCSHDWLIRGRWLWYSTVPQAKLPPLSWVQLWLLVRHHHGWPCWLLITSHNIIVGCHRMWLGLSSEPNCHGLHKSNRVTCERSSRVGLQGCWLLIVPIGGEAGRSWDSHPSIKAYLSKNMQFLPNCKHPQVEVYRSGGTRKRAPSSEPMESYCPCGVQTV